MERTKTSFGWTGATVWLKEKRSAMALESNTRVVEKKTPATLRGGKSRLLNASLIEHTPGEKVTCFDSRLPLRPSEFHDFRRPDLPMRFLFLCHPRHTSTACPDYL